MNSIDCQQLEQWLFEFVNGELDATISSMLDMHIAACQPCVVHVETYRATVHLTRQLSHSPVPQDAMARIRTAIQQQMPEV